MNSLETGFITKKTYHSVLHLKFPILSAMKPASGGPITSATGMTLFTTATLRYRRRRRACEDPHPIDDVAVVAQACVVRFLLPSALISGHRQSLVPGISGIDQSGLFVRRSQNARVTYL